MDKKYQVFVSSTYSDLREARNKAIEIILDMYHFPVGMEMFSAANSDQWEVITDAIDSSDYYVLIIGHRYGSVADDGVSYTEKEYDYAKKKEVPILVFVRERDTPVKGSHRDNQKEKLDAFIVKAAGSDRICSFWTDELDLTNKIQTALNKSFKRYNRIGWTRGNSNSEEVLGEMAELIKENRTLRERNTELESKIKVEKPCIEVLLDSESKLTLNIPSVFHGKIDEIPKLFSESDIPKHLADHISLSDISSYNEKIPSQEIIDEYNDKRRLCWLEYNAKPLNIFIQNIGSCKANDVNIVIKFPNNVLVLEVKNKNKMGVPKSPLHSTPIEKAERRIKEEQERQNNTILFAAHSAFPIHHIENPLARITKEMAHLNRTEWIEVNGNTVEISVKSLLHHTKGYGFDDIILIPTKEGSEYAVVSVICEEFRKNETMQIEINVTES